MNNTPHEALRHEPPPPHRALREHAELSPPEPDPANAGELADWTPEIGAAAFLQEEANLRAMDRSEVLLPNLDRRRAVRVALRLVANLRRPGPKALFAQLPAAIMHGASADALERQARALWYLESQLQTGTTSAEGKRAASEAVQDAVALRARMLRVLGYYLAANEAIQTELARMGRCRGHRELAALLRRLADHYAAFRAQIAVDKVFYDEADEARARALAHRLVERFARPDDTETADLRNRAWTRMALTYSVLKAAADLLYITSPAEAAAFPALRTAVLSTDSGARADLHAG